MCLGKKAFCLLMLLFAVAAGAQESAKESTRTKTKKKSPKVIAPYAIGVSYMMWNEDLKISQAGDSAKGFANFGGYGLSLEKSWMRGRWLHGGTLAYAFGKASSGGFDSTPTFADGINRAWSAGQLSAYSYYRWNTTFMMGLGALARYRMVDWKPQDESLTVDSGSKAAVTAQILLRWRVNNRFSFIQAYTPLNFKNSTMWTWTAQVAL